MNVVKKLSHGVEIEARGYINDKLHHMMRALKLDKRMYKHLKNAVSDVVQLLVRMSATSRVLRYKTAGLRSGETSQWQIPQSAILNTNRETVPQERAGSQ